MNRLLDTVYAKHQAWLERGDDRQGVHEPSPEGLAARRLERARVLLVAGGAVGYRAAASLASLPLGLLTLFPMSEADVEPLAQVVKQTRRRAKELNKAPLTFRTPNFVLTAAKYHLVAFAGERPYPDLFESVNESCVRVEAAWTRVTLWGAEITLGPTVLPGATACYNCYMLRRLSNNSRPEVWQAQEQFLRNDPNFTFKGRIAPLVNVAAAYLTAEVGRFLTARPAPLALGHEVLFDGLSLTQTNSFVVPVEGCKVCRGLWPEGKDADETFLEMVRRAARLSEVSAHAGQ